MGYEQIAAVWHNELKFLCEEGYNTLCIDFRSQGESPGKHITMGYLEAMDAMSGVKFLRVNGFPEFLLEYSGHRLEEQLL